MVGVHGLGNALWVGFKPKFFYLLHHSGIKFEGERKRDCLSEKSTHNISNKTLTQTS